MELLRWYGIPTPSLDFGSIFESAKGIGDTPLPLSNIPSNLANQNFDIGGGDGAQHF